MYAIASIGFSRYSTQTVNLKYHQKHSLSKIFDSPIIITSTVYDSSFSCVTDQSSWPFSHMPGAAPLYDGYRGRQEDCAGVLDDAQQWSVGS